MGFESSPFVDKKEKTLGKLWEEAFKVAREYRKAAEARGDFGSEGYGHFQNTRFKLQKAIEDLKRRGVTEDNSGIQKLREELEYPKEMPR